MATRLSTGAANALGGGGVNEVFLGDDISFNAATSKIASAANGFLNAVAGNKVLIKGSVSNDGEYTVVAVGEGGADVEVAQTLVNESAGATIAAVLVAKGGSFKEVFDKGILAIFSGAQPSSADNAESGSLLVLFTDSSGAFSAGAGTNGLQFEDAIGAVVSKKSDQIWSGVPVATGTAGYARLYDKNYVTGASVTAVRMDMLCGQSIGEVRMASTAIVLGNEIATEYASFTIPTI